MWPPDAPARLKRAGWPEDLVWLPNGEWMKGWAHHQTSPDGTKTVYQGGVICSVRALERARQTIPEDLKRHPYKCRFIDTTTASPWREDYNPAHPLTRSGDRRYKMALLEFCSVVRRVHGYARGIGQACARSRTAVSAIGLDPVAGKGGDDATAVYPPNSVVECFADVHIAGAVRRYPSGRIDAGQSGEIAISAIRLDAIASDHCNDPVRAHLADAVVAVVDDIEVRGSIEGHPSWRLEAGERGGTASPLKPWLPLPAMVVMMPFAPIFRIRSLP